MFGGKFDNISEEEKKKIEGLALGGRSFEEKEYKRETNCNSFIDVTNKEPTLSIDYDKKDSLQYIEFIFKKSEELKEKMKNAFTWTQKESFLKELANSIPEKSEPHIQRNIIVIDILEKVLVDSDALLLYGAARMTGKNGFEEYLQCQGFEPYLEDWLLAITC